jgi:protein O-GlcNAc transferase
MLPMARLTAQQAFDRAIEHHQHDRLNEAEELYRQVLALQPAHIDATHLLGALKHQQGRNDLAADLFRKSITLRPNFPEAHNNLGLALSALGQLEEAVAAYRNAVRLRPDYPSALHNLGVALQCRGEFDEAIAACRRAIALRPEYVEAYNNLGNALKGKGAIDEAITALRQAVTLRPSYALAHSNLGNALKDKGYLGEAIESLRMAIALNPTLPEAHYNLGNVLCENGEPDEGIAAYRRAIALRPGFAHCHSNLGNALKSVGQLDAAIASYRQAISLSSDFVIPHSNLIFAMHSHASVDNRSIAAELVCWNQQHGEPLRRFIQTHPNDRDPHRRLRIGYTSADFWAHASAHFLIPLLESHDRGQIEMFCYSDVRRPDAVTQRLQRRADHWRHIVGLSDERVAEQIREDKIDILVDLKLHTQDNRLLVFAQKPAPVQATWLGFPHSTGLSTIDYRLSDWYLDPVDVDESAYSESIVRLPGCFWCYDPLDERDIPVNASPAGNSGVVTFGCLNQSYKINDGMLSLWGQVLHQVRDSKILLMVPAGSQRERISDRLALQGIDPARIEFVSRLSRRNYMELYQRIDVCLDCFPYNGHTTSLDSYWMGVPVVTLAGHTTCSRAGWSQLSNLGLTELAGHTAEQFVNIAVELARDLPRQRVLRSTLRQRMEHSPLMDAPRFARNFEVAYRQMWRKWCAATTSQD